MNVQRTHICSKPASRLIGSQTAYIRNFNHSNISKVHLARSWLATRTPRLRQKGLLSLKRLLRLSSRGMAVLTMFTARLRSRTQESPFHPVP
ncbi:hypothetical protein QR685DRAFT_28949 [Neurospora intermedia]|uniref:Uncharacterized protein n=1 Tax=Neurospora intermedia TaxID=5142 RepID=A0ABR3DQP1_NEUIN